jgi:hypothetical protein
MGKKSSRKNVSEGLRSSRRTSKREGLGSAPTASRKPKVATAPDWKQVLKEGAHLEKRRVKKTPLPPALEISLPTDDDIDESDSEVFASHRHNILDYNENTISTDNTNVVDHPSYNTLAESCKEIRLLSLLPGRWDDPITCNLVTISLNVTHPPFETLSYVWQGVVETNTVVVDGTTCRVTGNLFLALRRLRKPAGTRLLWADGLCIDQNSTSERSHQVGLMGEIYKSCDRVYIWLGDYQRGVQSELLKTMTFDETKGPSNGNWSSNESIKRDWAYQAFWLIHWLAENNHWEDLPSATPPEVFEIFSQISFSPWGSPMGGPGGCTSSRCNTSSRLYVYSVENV